MPNLNILIKNNKGITTAKKNIAVFEKTVINEKE